MSEVPPQATAVEPPRRSRRPRILWTLLGAILVAGLLPLIVSHYFLTGINRESLETLEKKYLTRSAVSIANDIANVIANNRDQLTKVAGSLAILEKALPAGTDPFIYVASTGWVGDFISPESDLVALRVVNPQGRGAEVKPAEIEAEILQDMETARGVALGGQESTLPIRTLTSSNQPVIVLSVPVRNEGRVTGAVVGLVSLRKIVDRIREEGKGDVTAFVVDRDGRVLLHSEPAVEVQHPDFSNLKIVRDFAAAPQIRITESYTDGHSGRNVKVLGTVAPAAANVGVVVQKPEDRAFASVNEMIRATILWGSIALVLAIVAATLFAAGIARPIRLLADRTREIAEGNYQQRVDLKTHNEIGELAENFNIMSSSVESAVEKLKQAAQENHLLFINSVRMLAAAIDAKDPYTRGHSERVARYSIAIGKHLPLTDQEMRNLRISALLHDVGKIGIDDRILRKPGALNDEEFEIMKQHPAKGAAIMSGVAQLIDIIPGMKYHHEKWAGGGYPDGLVAEDIPMQARIVAIADTFDAMTTNRPYQKAMELGYVVEKIASFAASRFDPAVIEAFVAAVKQGDIQIDEQVRGAA
ncbi:MAG: HD domain-containing phosphohydrolase [Thermoanaerobaculia bacterium]